MASAGYSSRMGNELGILRKKYRTLIAVLDERGRRVWAAAEAGSLPRGGVSLVARATGLSRTTIHAGIREFESRKAKPLETGRSRRAGAGRKPLTFHYPDLLKALELLVEPLWLGVTRNRSCAGSRKARVTWLANCSGKDITSATAR